MNYDTPNLRTDLVFRGTMPNNDFKKLRLGEELMIVDFCENRAKLIDKMCRHGRPLGVKYRVTAVANRTYIKCLPRPNPRAKAGRGVARRRVPDTTRTQWTRCADTGVYTCYDFDRSHVWTIEPADDKVWPWLIRRDGREAGKGRTIYAAKNLVRTMK